MTGREREADKRGGNVITHLWRGHGGRSDHLLLGMSGKQEEAGGFSWCRGARQMARNGETLWVEGTAESSVLHPLQMGPSGFVSLILHLEFPQET